MQKKVYLLNRCFQSVYSPMSSKEQFLPNNEKSISYLKKNAIATLRTIKFCFNNNEKTETYTRRLESGCGITRPQKTVKNLLEYYKVLTLFLPLRYRKMYEHPTVRKLIKHGFVMNKSYCQVSYPSFILCRLW